MDAPCAIGRVDGGEAWVGFRRTEGSAYEVVVGAGDRVRPLSGEGLPLAAAIAYFEEALADAPPDLEATHEDVAALVRWIAAGEDDPTRAGLLAEAVDAIDDGLAGDAVAARLMTLWVEPGEPVDVLLDRARRALAAASGDGQPI